MNHGSKRMWFKYLLAIFIACAATPGNALIRQLYSLQQIIDASDVVAEVEVQEVTADPKKAVFKVTKALKGYPEIRQIKLNLAQGEIWYPEAMVKRLKPGQKGIFYYDITGNSYRSLANVNGLWIQAIAGKQVDMNDRWWRFVQIEQWMHRTYKGSTEDLIELTKGVIAGTHPSPEPDASLPKMSYEEIMGKTMPDHLAERSTARTEAWRKKILLQYRASNAADGYEAIPSWKAEDFASGSRMLEDVVDPAWKDETVAHTPKIVLLEDQDKRGQILEVSYEKGAKSRIMSVSRDLRASFMRGRFLALEAKVTSAKPIELYCVLWTEDKTESYTSEPVLIKPGSWKYDVVIPLYGEGFRTAESDGNYDSEAMEGLRIGKLEFLIRGNDAAATILFDRIRLERRPYYIRSIRMPHKGNANGITCTDYDGDSDLDVLICTTNGNSLYRNDEGEYVDVTEESGLLGGSHCAGWADYDHDGDLDLLLSTPALWENRDGTFHDVTKLLPKLSAYNTEGAGWMDANGDGWADILLSNGEHGLYLFINKASNRAGFADASKKWGLGPDGPGNIDGDYLSISDFDGDGYPDFLYNAGQGLLMRNVDGSAFEEVHGSMIEYATGKGRELGTTFVDINHDGLLDIFVAQLAKSRVYINNNDMTYLDFTHRTSRLNRLHANVRSILTTDTDLDGDHDVILGVSDRPSYLLENNGFQAFEDKTTPAALASFPEVNQVSGMLAVDWDDDGDEDVLVVGKTAACVLINASHSTKRTSLNVILDSTETPGALIRVYDQKDKAVCVAQMGLSQNFCSQGPMKTCISLDPGKYVVSVLFSDGHMEEADVTIKKKHPAVCKISR